jgi:hypothetical protein
VEFTHHGAPDDLQDDLDLDLDLDEDDDETAGDDDEIAQEEAR